MAHRSRLILPLIVLPFIGLSLIAPSAAAQSWYRDDRCTVKAGSFDKVQSGHAYFYCFTGTTDSDLIEIAAPSATVCLDPDTSSESATGAKVYVRWCISKPSGGEAKENRCIKVLTDHDGGGITPNDDLPLDGDDGSVARQRACIYGVPRGLVYVDVVQAPPSGKTAVVRIQGD